MFKKIKQSLALRISFISCIMLLVVSLLVGALGLFFYHRDEIKANSNIAKMTAIAIVQNIDGDEYERITKNFEETEYHKELQTYVDKVKQNTGVMYIYGVDTAPEGETRYVFDAVTSNDDQDLIGYLGFTEKQGVFDEAMYETITTGEPNASWISKSGDYGIMVSGFAPIINSSGDVVGAVCVDISMETVVSTIGHFALMIFLAAILSTIVCGVVLVLFIRKIVGVPIKTLATASQQMSQGDMNISISATSQDEMGELTESFIKMVESNRKQVEILSRIADSDYTDKAVVRSDNDDLNKAIQKIIDNNIKLISEIRYSAETVAGGASQVKESAKAVANGSQQQTQILENFSSSISNINTKAGENNQLTGEGLSGVAHIEELMKKCTAEIREMNNAMGDIKNSSERISIVMKVIDDIAFQTNILSLNAAVEAARAGVQGKGFAVVADEVRALAQKSTEASKETATMINDSLENVHKGSQIAIAAEKMLKEVTEIVESSAMSMTQINESSKLQSEAIQEMDSGVQEISSVVISNSTTAEQSATSASEMNAQALHLKEIISNFKLPE